MNENVNKIKGLDLMDTEYFDYQSYYCFTDTINLTDQVYVEKGAGITLITGKEYVEEGNELSGVSIKKADLEAVYAKDIESNSLIEFKTREELDAIVANHTKDGYYPGTLQEYRSSEDYFEKLASEVGYNESNELNQPIIKLEKLPSGVLYNQNNQVNTGYHTEEEALSIIEQCNRSENHWIERGYDEYRNPETYGYEDDYKTEKIRLSLYTKSVLSQQTPEKMNGKEYLESKSKKVDNAPETEKQEKKLNQQKIYLKRLGIER